MFFPLSLFTVLYFLLLIFHLMIFYTVSFIPKDDLNWLIVTHLTGFLNSSFPGLITGKQDNVTYLTELSKNIVTLMASKDPDSMIKSSFMLEGGYNPPCVANATFIKYVKVRFC